MYHIIHYQVEEAGQDDYAMFSPLVPFKCGPWYLFWRVTNFCWQHNTAKSLHMWGTTTNQSKFVRRRPWSTMSYDFLISRKIIKMGYWSTLANSCATLSSNISVPVTLHAQKPCRTSWRRTLVLRRMSMISFTTFHSNYKRPIPRVSTLPLGIRTSIVHPISIGISRAATYLH